MKIFTFLNIGIVSFTLASIASADDFLARATQGKLSDNTKGVHALSETESKGVKGGYAVSTGLIRYQNLGMGASITEVGAAIQPTVTEILANAICGIGSSTCSSSSVNKLRYQELVMKADPWRGEVLVVTATKTTRPGAFGISIPTFRYGFAVLTQNGMLRRVADGGYIGSEVMYRYKNELNRMLLRYR